MFFGFLWIFYEHWELFTYLDILYTFHVLKYWYVTSSCWFVPVFTTVFLGEFSFIILGSPAEYIFWISLPSSCDFHTSSDSWLFTEVWVNLASNLADFNSFMIWIVSNLLISRSTFTLQNIRMDTSYYYYFYYYYSLLFFTPALTGNLSLESEWQ